MRDVINDTEKIVCFMGSERDEDKRTIPESIDDSVVDKMKKHEEELAAQQKASHSCLDSFERRTLAHGPLVVEIPSWGGNRKGGGNTSCLRHPWKRTRG